MIDKVQLQQIVNYIVEKERKGIQKSTKQDKEVEITLSRAVRDKTPTDYEDIQKKVESIKEQIAKGAYRVDPESIVKGIERHLSSR